jgi:hypothetical protein
VGALVPASRPALPLIDRAVTHVARKTVSLFTDDAGQADVSSAVMRTAIIVALVAFVVGGLIYDAVVGLGHDTASDIRSAGGWGG